MAATRVSRSRTASICLSAALLVLLSNMPGAFVTGVTGAHTLGSRVALRAEAPTPAAPSPAPAPESVALVKVDEKSMETTAGVLGGIAGLLVGGVWLGAATFAAGAYLAKKEDSDVSAGLKGLSKGVLEGLNFSNYVNDKYSVSTQVGGAIGSAIDKNVKPEDKKSLDDAVAAVASSVESFDKDVNIKKTFGEFATTAAELANEAVIKAVKFNEENKVTDKIAEKIQEVIAKAQEKKGSPPSP